MTVTLQINFYESNQWPLGYELTSYNLLDKASLSYQTSGIICGILSQCKSFITVSDLKRQLIVDFQWMCCLRHSYLWLGQGKPFIPWVDPGDKSIKTHYCDF